jgi:hypothetical protein
MLCPYCGEEEVFEIFEVYIEQRTFQVETCCYASHEAMSRELERAAREDPRALARWFEAETGLPARQIVADAEAGGRFGNAGICIDNGLHLADIDFRRACAWIERHHRHNSAPQGWRWGHAVYNGRQLVAVATVGRPVARMIDGSTTVEVTRLCVDPEQPSWLTWNACSMLYAAAAKEARRRGYERVITYTREDESGHTLRASGWLTTHRTQRRRRNGWASRDGRKQIEPCRKYRHERGLTKQARKDIKRRSATFEAKQSRRKEGGHDQHQRL